MKAEYIYMTVVAPSFIALPIVAAFSSYRKLPKEARVLLYYLFTDALVSITSSLLAAKGITNLPLYHVATIIEAVMLFYFFTLILKDRAVIYGYLLIIVFPVLAVVNMFLFQSIFSFNSYALSLMALLVISCCFIYWWQYDNEQGKTWKDIPLNWMLSGMLLYFSSSFVLLTFSNIIVSLARNVSILLWNIHATLSVIMYCLLTFGFIKYRYGR